jgi:O-antigen/teichoic acid export membrane protein
VDRLLKSILNPSPTAWVTVQTVLTQIIGLALFAVQAPLLGPTAFGLFSFVMVFISLCEIVLGSGATDALLSIATIESRHYAVVTTVSLLVALALGVAIFAAASPLAAFCGQPALVPLFRWMAVLPVINAFGPAPNAATKRDMLFRPLAVRAIVGQLAGGIVGVVLALRGYGAWALVWQAIIQRLVSVLILWLAVPIKLRFTWSRSHFREVWKFAAPVILSSVMGWAWGQIPRLVLGLFLGPTDLGLFSMAARLNDIVVQAAIFPSTAVARVSLRHLAANTEARDAAIHRVLFRMSALCFPLCIGGAAALPALFHVWLDPRWAGAIVPSQLMLLSCVPLVAAYMSSAVLLASNQQPADAFLSTLQAVLIALFALVSAPFGLLVAVAALAVRPVLMLPIQLGVLARKCAVRAHVMLRPQIPMLVASTLLGIGMGWLRSYLEARYGGVIALTLVCGAGAVSYGLLMIVFFQGGFDEVVSRLRRFA